MLPLSFAQVGDAVMVLTSLRWNKKKADSEE
jgi:hypothetical protein